MSKRWPGQSLGLALLATLAGEVAAARSVDLVGLNVAGAEFAEKALPGRHGQHYYFPGPDYFERWRARGLRMVRLPIKWERLQPRLFGEFDGGYAGLIDLTLARAAASDVQVILDVHNYARYRGEPIGSPVVPIAAYADLLERLALRWQDAPALWGYDLMNEPHGIAERHWAQAAQAGIDAIRRHDRRRPLLIEGYYWSSSRRWPHLAEPLLALTDPADQLIFSAHAYIDANGSGRYGAPPGEDFDPMIGVERVRPFVEWLIRHGRRGHIGEFGVPDDDPRWLAAMDNLLAYLREHCIPMTYWAAGPGWGGYPLAVEPHQGRDRPQWAVLQRYLGDGGCREIGPRPAGR